MITSEDNNEWPLEPIDKLGRPMKVGDWVHLVEIPPSVATMPQETRDIFRRALGKTFKIYEFDEWGMAWLNLSKKVERSHTIGVEPPCLLLTRRMRKKP